MILKAALLGCGRMGLCHARVLKNLGCDLVAVADPITAASTSLLDSVGYTHTNIYENLSSLLSNHIPDLLVIATTANAHIDHALEAINAGVRLIFLEKPLATSLIQADQLRKACEINEVRIAVNHQMRFLPQYTIPQSLLSTSSYGGFKSMHVSAGNFGMAMNGTHYFEAFRLLADEPSSGVNAWFDVDPLPNPRGPHFKDVSGCIRVTTSSGHRLYIDASSDQGHGVQVTYMGRNGRITIDELSGLMTTVVRKSEHLEAPTSRYGMPVDVNHQQIPPVELFDSTLHVLQALIAGKNYPTILDATLSIKILVAAYHSHRLGGSTVSLTSVSDTDPELFAWA